MTYALMVLLLLSTVIVAITALASVSYTSAVSTVADDQAYYYAKSIGLAVKRQFLDGYSIDKIINELDEKIAKKKEAVVTGTYTIETETQQDLVNGTVSIRYGTDLAGNTNPYVLEVRVACIYNGAFSVVTSVFSCEDALDKTTERILDAFNEYDVVLTNTKDMSFNFADANGSASNLNVYVYAGEDDSVVNPEFKLYVDLNGNLTTTGQTSISGKTIYNNAEYDYMHTIKGKLTSYGDLTLKTIKVNGALHSAGYVYMSHGASVGESNIYARGDVVIFSGYDPVTGATYAAYANSTKNGFSNDGTGKYYTNGPFNYVCNSIYSQGAVIVFPKNSIKGDIVARKSVEVIGYTRPPEEGNILPMLLHTTDASGAHLYERGGNTYVGGNVYCDGDVTIHHGAVVMGNVVANGDVHIQCGAVVMGNVTSVTGNVSVENAGVVCGSVWAKNYINLVNGYPDEDAANVWFNSYVLTWASNVGSWYPGFVWGGIGLKEKNGKTPEHHCAQLFTPNTKYTMTVTGNLFVHGEGSYAGGTTDLSAVWIMGNIYLENTRATFNNRYLTNYAGNVSTQVYALYQQTDLWSGDNTIWLDLHGSSIGKIVCRSFTDSSLYYDAFIINGVLQKYYADAAIYARCVGVNNMDVAVGYDVFAKQWFQTAGYAWAETTDPESISTVALSMINNGYLSGTTFWRGNNSINVECVPVEGYDGNVTSYNGALGGSINFGVVMLDSTWVQFGKENVTPRAGSNVTILAGNAIYAKVNANVQNFILSGNANLSTIKGAPTGPGYRSATINASVSGTFTLLYGGVFENTNVRMNPRIGGSVLNLFGNASILGRAFTVNHYKGNISFRNGTQIGLVERSFWSKGEGIISPAGSFGTIELTNASSTLVPAGALTITGDLKTNGNYSNPEKYLVTVSGNMYVGNYSYNGSDANLYLRSVGKNLTIIAKDAGTPVIFGRYSVKGGSVSPSVTGGLNCKNIALTLNAGLTVGAVSSESGMTVNGATINGNVVAENGTLTVKGSSDLRGNVKAKNLVIEGGTINGSGLSYGINVTGVLTQKGGTLSGVKVTVSGNPTGGPALNVTGGAADSCLINVTKGGTSITGGTSVNYTGVKLFSAKAATIAAHFEGGATTNGSLTIGSDSDSSSYVVGRGINTSPDGDSYYAFYAEGSITWKGKATGPLSDAKYAARVGLTAKSNVVIGSSSNVIKGYLGYISSLNGSVTAYVERASAISAKTSALAHVTVQMGSSSYAGSTGTGMSVTGNATLQGGGLFLGHYEVSGKVTIASKVDLTALIKCSTIEGLDKVTTHYKNTIGKDAIYLSLYLTGYSGKTYELKHSLAKDPTYGTTGSITVKPGNLSFASSVAVEGEIYVEGIFTYNGSQTNLVSFGGLRCANSEVNFQKDYKGSIDLPNVTSITLSAAVTGQLNAPNVTSITLNYNVAGVASFPKVENISVRSGITLGGLEISPTGTVTNNGTITGGVSCGNYTGSGTVNGPLVLNDAARASVTISSGSVKGNIWSKSALVFGAANIGGSGTYVYSEKDITATKTVFASNMSYIRSSGGNMTFKNCRSLPAVQNSYSKGVITFSNDQSTPATIASVLSTGKQISFGNASNTGWQTVKGDVQWTGSNAGADGIDSWQKAGNGAAAVIEGNLICAGTGNLCMNINVKKSVYLRNTGSAELRTGSIGIDLYVNSSGSIPVTSLTWTTKYGNIVNVAGDVVAFGTKSGNMKSLTTNGTIGGYMYVNGMNSVTVGKKITGQLRAVNCANVTTNAEIGSAELDLYGGQFTSNAKMNGSLFAYNTHCKVLADVNGHVTTTSNVAGVYFTELGSMSKTINVGSSSNKTNINVRGILVDNSHNYGTIKCMGYYLGDIKKVYKDSGTLYFDFDSMGVCYVFSGNTSDADNVMNGDLNINGWLLMFNYSASRKMTIKGTVYCKNLSVNTPNWSPAGGFGNYISVAFGRKTTELRENIGTGGPANLTANTSNTTRDMMKFTKPVYVTTDNVNYRGTAAVANTTFDAGSCLVTDGQACLSNCIVKSVGWKSDTGTSRTGAHCTISADKSVASANDGSLFVHRQNESITGDSFFLNVETHSNVSVYYGKTYLNGNAKFMGVTTATSNGVSGSNLSKMFYFGDGLEIYGGGISAVSASSASKAPAARTIIWIPRGNLIIGNGAYIGKTLSNPPKSGLTAKEGSINPGIFVSSGYAWIYGTCTLDIYAKVMIAVDATGIVTGKDYNSDGRRYKAGLYITAGYIYVMKTNGNWYTDYSNNASGLAGFFGYFACRDNGRWFYAANDLSQKTDASMYVPYGSSYASFVQSIMKNGTTLAYNSAYYTPNTSIHASPAPTGVPSSDQTNLKKRNFSISYDNPPSLASMPAVPSKPSIGTATSSGGSYTAGQMSPLNIKSTIEPWEKGIMSFTAVNPIVSSVSGPTTEKSASVYGATFTNPSLTFKTRPTPQRSAAGWTADTAKHFDQTNKTYWSTRLIPYVWGLPYNPGDSAGINPAKRVLTELYADKGQEEDEGVRLAWGNSGAKVTQNGETYYITEKAWEKSALQSYISSIVSRRKKGNENCYYDYIKRRSRDYTDRITELMVFESGELPYSAFNMSLGADRASWSGSTYSAPDLSPSSVSFSYIYTRYFLNKDVALTADSYKPQSSKSIPYSMLHGNHSKKIANVPQIAWYQGHTGCSYYNVLWYFFACEDPTNPYGSKPKDLHVIMPQGVGMQWMYDNDNAFQVIGKGRVFIYFTSGNTFHFWGRNGDSSKPFGTMNSSKNPQLYLIGSGTNIDLIIDGMPLYAFVYMPFGWSKDVYGSSGSLKQLNTYSDESIGGANLGYKNGTTVTTVKRNALTLGFDTGSGTRPIYGKIVADNFYYEPTSTVQLGFKGNVKADLSDTTIYGKSKVVNGRITFGDSKVTRSIGSMLTLPPDFSTTMLDWKYESIRVES